eukprot:UN18349
MESIILQYHVFPYNQNCASIFQVSKNFLVFSIYFLFPQLFVICLFHHLTFLYVCHSQLDAQTKTSSFLFMGK